ncbi:MAG: CBS domain-containing protein [Nitrosomonadales bacterium]|jgi:CBS domain-containing protein|nr:MAG: CBS domain-containing protein [Nitrosomonadales bacterium]
MQDKIHEVASIEPDKSAHDAMQLMSDKKIGALLVLGAGKLIGIISERHYLAKQKRYINLYKMFYKGNHEQSCGACKSR